MLVTTGVAGGTNPLWRDAAAGLGPAGT
jgi:hypothetical protein